MEGMTSLLSTIGAVFTQSVEWVGSILDVITTEPVLILTCIAMPVIGFAVGLLNRLFRTN